MKRIFSVSVMSLFLVGFLFAGFAFADKKDDIMVLITKGTAFIEANGIEKTATEFTKDSYKNGDLYLFAYTYDGVCQANGAKPRLVGKNMSKLKTPEGDYHIQNLVKVAKSGGDWWDYRWVHPKTKKLTGKVSYIMPVDGMNAFVGCGYWKE